MDRLSGIMMQAVVREVRKVEGAAIVKIENPALTLKLEVNEFCGWKKGDDVTVRVQLCPPEFEEDGREMK